MGLYSALGLKNVGSSIAQILASLTGQDLVVASLKTTAVANGPTGLSPSAIPSHLGGYSSNAAALWLTTSPSSSNYALHQTEGGATAVNARATLGINFQVGGVTKASMDSTGGIASAALANTAAFSLVDLARVSWPTSYIAANSNALNFVSNGGQVLTLDRGTTPVATIGTGLSSVALIGTLTTNTTLVGSGADTTEDNLMTYSLPASTLTTDGRGVRITAWGDGVSTADVTTVKGYFGATAVVTKVLTASQANTWRATFEVLRTGAATQIATGNIWNGGTAASLTQSNASPGETLSGAVTIKFTGQRTVSSVANSVRQLGMIIEAI